MKFDKKTLSEAIESELVGSKHFTNGKKQNIIVNESQLDRLLMKVNNNNPTKINNIIIETFKIIRKAIVKENLDLNVRDYSDAVISESQDEWRGHNPGASAAAGIENIINSVTKAYDMIKDSDTRRKLANSITKLGNFMTYSAELVGSGSSQRAPRSYEDVSDDLPYPELEEGVKPDFLDLDGDGDKKESMKKASKEVKDDVVEQGVIDKMKMRNAEGGTKETEKGGKLVSVDATPENEKVTETVKEEKERLIREDIKTMKRIINPISKI
tara:strand:- start:3069 stop:3878 length:810 start_codon:yes stop_codon:yes gene_type:complete